MVRYIFLGSTILFVSVSSANAAVFDGLDGKTLNYQYYYPNLSYPSGSADNGDKLVGAGIEVNNTVFNTGTMDIFNTGFIVNFTGDWTFDFGANYNGFELTDVSDDIPDFSAFDWMLTTNTLLTMDNVMIGTSKMGIDWKGLEVNSNSYIQLEVSAVPVPAAIWLFGSALIGLVGMSRRTKAT